MKFGLDCFCRLVEPSTNSEIACYPIHSILFCARGSAESEERRCFAFTCSHGDSVETAIFQCHVFRCDVTEAVMLCLSLFITFITPNFLPGSVASDTTKLGYRYIGLIYPYFVFFAILFFFCL